MTTFFLDPEGGDDGNDGLTFANRWRSFTNGATAARIAPGDIIRVIGSPAPTSLGVNGTWVDGPAAVAVNIVSSTNASPINVQATAHGLVTGDNVTIASHTTNTFANGTWVVTRVDDNNVTLDGSTGNGVGGASGTIRKINNCIVTLASELTKNVASYGNQGSGRTIWTASANVTAAFSATTKEGDNSDSLTIAAGFTTGLAAYKALGSAQDFSAFKQVTFWIRQVSGTVIVNGDISLRLCSDAAGVTTVNTIAVPAMGSTGRWQKFTVDTGAALGASIQSVALYVDTDRGAQVFLISNIVACKDRTAADSLSLTSLIGKNIAGDGWWPIRSIVGTKATLDGGINSSNLAATSIRGYSGTSETVTTYKRETLKTGFGMDQFETQEAGTAGNLIAYEGGWDRTAMTTQNLESWFSQNNIALEPGITLQHSFVSMNKIHAAHAGQGGVALNADSIVILGTTELSGNTGASPSALNVSANFCVVGDVVAVGNDGNGISGSSLVRQNTIGNITAKSNLQVGANFQAPALAAAIIASNNGTSGVAVTGGGTIDSITATKNLGAGLTPGHGLVVKSLTSSNNLGAGIAASIITGVKVFGGSTSGNALGAVTISSGNMMLRNVNIGESPEVTFSAPGDIGWVACEKLDGATGDNRIFFQSGTIISQTAVRHTASGLAWQMSPTSTTANATFPLPLKLATIACAANEEVTVSTWMRRDNTELTLKLVCPGDQLSGIPDDVESSMTAGADTWEEVTLQFTPTEAGVVEVFAYAYGGTTRNGYVDDMTISQA